MNRNEMLLFLHVNEYYSINVKKQGENNLLFQNKWCGLSHTFLDLSTEYKQFWPFPYFLL